jgi:hypothetical protein
MTWLNPPKLPGFFDMPFYMIIDFLEKSRERTAF